MGVSENGGTLFWGVLIIRILLSRVLYLDPLFLETPICVGFCDGLRFTVQALGSNYRCALWVLSHNRLLRGLPSQGYFKDSARVPWYALYHTVRLLSGRPLTRSDTLQLTMILAATSFVSLLEIQQRSKQ